MSKDIQDQIKQKEKEGWIKVQFMIEAMAINKEAVSSALEKHVDKMKHEKECLIYKVEDGEIREVNKPTPNIEKGYSKIIEVELLAQSFEKLIMLVVTYGPSAMEIIEPERYDLKMGEMQDILATIAQIIHRYAAMGAGGMVVST